MNIDITQPLSGSLTVTNEGHSMCVPLIYEDLHEVCPLCGGDSHQLDSCHKLPLNKKIEVIVEKFDAHDLGGASTKTAPSASSSPLTRENRVTVIPKKHLKASFGPRVLNLYRPSLHPLTLSLWSP